MLLLKDLGDSLPQNLSATVLHYMKLVWFACCVVVVIKLGLKFVELFQRRRRAEKELARFPSPKRHWLFGHLHLFKNNEESLKFLESLNLPYSPARVSWAGPFLARIILFHPSTAKALLTTTAPKDELFYGFLKEWLGDGLLLSKGKKWFRNRRLLTPGFHFDILKPYVTVFNNCASTLVTKWTNLCNSPDSNDLEMFEHISLLTLDSLLKCIFGQDSHCQTKKQHPYIQGVYSISRLLIDRSLFPPYYINAIYHISPSGFQFRKALKVVHDYTWKVINERKDTLAQEKQDGEKRDKKFVDFLDILLTAKDEDGNGLTDQEIKDEVDTFMFEGHDTTASGISWCLYNLANNPQHQQKCRQEVNDLLKDREKQEIEWDDLHKLQYLTLCIKESMRLNPPVPVIGRTTTSPLTLPDGRTIPAGYNVTLSMNLLHRNEHVWDKPTEFKPERFTPENSKDRSPYAYLPFSAGPRNCIGQNFAMNEMKIVLSTILHNFELGVVRDCLPDRSIGLVLRSNTGIRLHVKPCKCS
ncbi:cytochrome P450 4F3-like [Glandiceps talaboti]